MLIVMIGPPGCGKSTLARAWQAAAPDQVPDRVPDQVPDRVVVSTDAIRAQLFGDAAIQGDWGAIWREVCGQWGAAIAAGADALYDATNADRSQRQRVIQTARAMGFRPIVAWWVQTPVAQCQQWNRQRDRQVPPDVIDRMAAQIDRSPPSLDEGFDRVEVFNAGLID